MRRWIFFFKIYVVSACFVGTLLTYTIKEYPLTSINLKSQKIHVFIDYASSPTILQMVEMIKLPKEDIKIVAWKRYRNRKPLINNIQSNVYELNLLSPERNAVFIEEKVRALGRMYPNAGWYLHFNYKHIGWDPGVFLRLLPIKKVKELHLYEDGNGTFVRKFHKILPQEIQINIARFMNERKKQKEISYYAPYEYFLPLIYPTFIHAAFVDKVNQNMPPVTFVPVDFAELKKTLSKSDKEKLFYLLNFNPKEYEKLLNGKNMGIYLYDGYVSPERNKKTQFLKEKLANMENVVWFGKKHPAFRTITSNDDPFIPMNTDVPLEIFLISDLPLKYIAGEGSSAFYSVPPSMIVAYVPNYNHYYMEHLLKLGVLSSEKIYEKTIK